MKKELIDGILNSYEEIGGINYVDNCQLPSRKSIHLILYQLKDLLFPGFMAPISMGDKTIAQVTEEKVTEIGNELSEEISKSFQFYNQGETKEYYLNQSESVTEALILSIPMLRKELKEDIQSILNGDPAAVSESEVILAYPGLKAILGYRIAHFLHLQGVPLIPRLMSEIIHSETGVDIHPAAVIGKRFCIDHGTGIVIGETSEIGDDVKLYQGVTIGALSVSKDQAKKKRHPTIKDNVTIYARTTILGGGTVIGSNSIIGGNVWITKSIPANSKVYMSPVMQVQKSST